MTTTFQAFSAAEHLRSRGIDPATHSDGDLRAYYDREIRPYDEETQARKAELSQRTLRFAEFCDVAKPVPAPAVPPSPVREFKVGDRVLVGSAYLRAVVEYVRGDGRVMVIFGDSSRSHFLPADVQHDPHADPAPPVSQRDWEAEAKRIDPDADWQDNAVDGWHRWDLGPFSQRAGHPVSMHALGHDPANIALARLLEDRNAADERNGPDRYRRVEDWDARLQAIAPGCGWQETSVPKQRCRWIIYGEVALYLDGSLVPNDHEVDPALVALVRERNADQLAEAKRGAPVCRAGKHEFAGEDGPCECGAIGGERPAPADDFLAQMAGAK